MLAYSRRIAAEHSPTGREDTVITVVNLDPHSQRETTVHLDMPGLGMDWDDSFVAHDLLSGQSWNWGENVFVRLGFETPGARGARQEGLSVDAPGEATLDPPLPHLLHGWMPAQRWYPAKGRGVSLR